MIDETQPKFEVTVSVTLYVPSAPYVCEGLCVVDELLSPKFQVQPAIPVAAKERSTKFVDTFRHAALLLNAGFGAGNNSITRVSVIALHTPLFPEVNINDTEPAAVSAALGM